MNRNMDAITWALKARGISPTARVLLMELCSHVNSGRDDFDVWPSHRLLAEEVEISVSGVKRHLNELAEAGYIEAQPGVRDNGGKSSNIYRIMVDTISIMPKKRKVHIRNPIGQSDLGDSSPVDYAPQFTADLCREPLKERTSLIEDSPLSLTGEATPTDLFEDDSSNALVVAKPSLIEYVGEKWEALCTDFPRTHRIQVWNDARKKAVARRAAEFVRSMNGEVDAYWVWDRMFEAIRADRWLRGEGEPTKNYPTPFSLDIDYITRVRVFAQTLEKAANHERDNRITHTPGGRLMGPAEQAGIAALALLRASRERGK